jgi:hypothetical protein
MLDTPSEVVGDLLEGAITELDIPEPLRLAAVHEYQHVGSWLAGHADGHAGWHVYPQGSFLLGTVVRPAGGDEYDVDTVCRREIAKEAITKAELKAEVGAVLEQYVRARAADPGGPQSCDPRKRCWTLSYLDTFHLDVLPAIPCRDRSQSGINITDRDLHEWQYSDPQAYGRWFKQQMHAEFVAKRARLAEATHTPPEAIPEESVKTTLQRVVQVLKVHRNEFFADDLDERPASIIVTTLAAHAYRGEQDLYQAVLDAAQRMPDHIEWDGEQWLVPNPVEPRENFADKWTAEPQGAQRFFEWLVQLGDDLRDAEGLRGIDKVAARLSESFGATPVEKAVGRLGDRYRRTRESGRLSLATGTGVLSTAGTLPVKPHSFYGAS